LKGTRDVFVQLLDKLVARQQHAFADLVYIADSYAKLAVNDKARDQYDRIIKAAEADPNILPAKTGPAAVTRVRAQLVGLLRNDGKFQEAMQQVDQLIKNNPRDLAPLMEKGRILQSWSEADPKHYDEAVAHWTDLRTRLSRMQKKPPEFYEVVYNAASCLLAQAKKAGDKNKALQAEQLLKSTMVLSPSLSGPDMVAKYNDLLKTAIEMQGRSAQAASKR
jgi:tetratricopeptide (TPR) repeat protein